MTRDQLTSKIETLGFNYSFHQAMSGSQYVTINGIKFRVSDHIQPSHYQSRNYIDVHSYSAILNIIQDPAFKMPLYLNVECIDGELVQYIYEDDSDFFTEKKITKAEYENLLPFYENGENKLLK